MGYSLRFIHAQLYRVAHIQAGQVFSDTKYNHHFLYPNGKFSEITPRTEREVTTAHGMRGVK